MKLLKYRITYENEPSWMDYIVHAVNAFDARVMGEVWQKRWGKKSIQEISCEGPI
jgi:hypothetical protein